MNTEATSLHLFSRQPLSAFGKLAAMALSGAAVSSGILAIIIGYPDNLALLIITAALLVCAGLAATGFRWMPLLITIVSGVFLYEVSTQPYVTYHLTNPKEGGFLEFVLDLLIVAFIFVAFGTAIGATVQPYLRSGNKAPRWLPAALTTIAGIVIGAIFIASIAQTSAAAGTASTTYTNGVATVHMSAANFSQSSVTIVKGSKLLLVDDVSILHILTNGSWQSGVAKSAHEAGAPTVNNVQVNGNSTEIGPFTTAGTYHIYCIVHQGMNLTIIVQ